MVYMKKNGVYEENSCIQRDMTFSSKVLDECQRHGRTEERSKLNRKASEGETELVQVDKPLEPNLLQIRKTSAKTIKCTMELKMNKCKQQKQKVNHIEKAKAPQHIQDIIYRYIQ